MNEPFLIPSYSRLLTHHRILAFLNLQISRFCFHESNFSFPLFLLNNSLNIQRGCDCVALMLLVRFCFRRCGSTWAFVDFSLNTSFSSLFNCWVCSNFVVVPHLTLMVCVCVFVVEFHSFSGHLTWTNFLSIFILRLFWFTSSPLFDEPIRSGRFL